MLYIESTKNARIKFLLELQSKRKEREQSELFPVEGTQEIILALEGGYRMETLFFCEEVADADLLKKLSVQTNEVVKISRQVFQKVAYRNSTGGVIGLFHWPFFDLDEFTPPKNALILVAESIEKPGNVGALLRTADAAKLDAVILADPLADFFNPNTIRGSVGTVFTNNIFNTSAEKIIAWLKKHNIKIFAAALQNSKPYFQQDFTGPTAIVVGTEADGLTQKFREAATENVLIPMQGKVDSMNVSVSAGILIFEAKRQRGFK